MGHILVEHVSAYVYVYTVHFFTRFYKGKKMSYHDEKKYTALHYKHKKTHMTRPFWHLSLPAAVLDSERCGEPRMPAVNGLDVGKQAMG
jgi:hypothetical protein